MASKDSIESIDQKIDKAHIKISELKKKAQEHLDAEALFSEGADLVERRKHAELADSYLRKIKYQEEVRLPELKERRGAASTPSFLPDTAGVDSQSQSPVPSSPVAPGCDVMP